MPDLPIPDEAARRGFDFAPFDADSHFYETVDAFTRHMDPALAARGVRQAVIDGEPHYLVGSKVFRGHAGTVPVAGRLYDFFRGNPERKSVDEFPPGVPLSSEPAYTNRDARLALMDRQGVAATWLFPSDGCFVETEFQPDITAALASFRALNRWIQEEWGFAYRDRIYAMPYLSLSDVDWAITELTWCLDHGARLFVMRNGPVYTPEGTTSPADPRFDRFWALVQEADIPAVTHIGLDDGYGFLGPMWEPGTKRFSFPQILGQMTTFLKAVPDFYAALVCHRLFERFPRLRFATVENGADWIPLLLKRINKADFENPGYFTSPAVEQFHEHVWVTPFFEDDIHELAQQIPVERILFGSDFPHQEGLADPLDFVKLLDGFSDHDVRRIMHGNVRELMKV